MIFSKRNTDLSENVGLEPKDKIQLILVCFWYSAFLGFPRKNRFVKYCYHKNILITIPNPGMWHDNFARDCQNLLIKLGSRPTFFDKSEFLLAIDPHITLKLDINYIQKLQVGMFLKNFSFIKILYHVWILIEWKWE